jgi:hypothetical protein
VEALPFHECETWDSKTIVLTERKVPLLHGPCTPNVGESLHAFQFFDSMVTAIHPFSPRHVSHGNAQALLTCLHFIWMLKMSLGVQMSAASKSSRTVFHPCAKVNPFFSLSVLPSTHSGGKSESPLSPLLLFLSQNNACASGDSHQLWLAVALAVGLGFISTVVLIAADACVWQSFSFSD